MTTMETYEVRPIFCPDYEFYKGNDFNLVTEAPGSKSLTNRAVMLAALSDGETQLEGILLSDDSRHFIQCIIDLGFETECHEAAHKIKIKGTGGRIPKDHVSINVGSAGTAARFLTAMLGCSEGTWHLDSSEQMKKRPMASLIRSLQEIGCEFEFDEKENFFPFTIKAHGIREDSVTVDISDSSQFLSALLMAAVLSDHDFTVNVTGAHGLAYVRMTTLLMEKFGIRVLEKNHNTCSPSSLSFVIPGGLLPKSGTYGIEPDASAAAYFYAMAAISGGRVLVKNLHSDSLQGDTAFIDLLVKMGCSARDCPDGIELTGPADGKLQGIDIDMGSFSDQALTLAAIAPYAQTPVVIRGTSHMRLQECDRIQAILDNLTRMGIGVTCDENDVITIYPGTPSPALIETYSDHRVAMAFAITGLKSPGIIIKDPLCCRKTFENYFEMLDWITGKNNL